MKINNNTDLRKARDIFQKIVDILDEGIELDKREANGEKISEEAVEELKFEIDNKMIRKTIFTNQAIEVVLKELDKKDKVIDEIAKDVGINSNYKKLIGRTVEERTEIVKDMYYKKVEEQEQ